jgi:hypothetical protein
MTVLLFGTARRRFRRDLDTRLRNLIEVSYREAERDVGPRPIPGPVHHALSALLEWMQQVDAAPSKDGMKALVLYETERDLAIAHVGGAEPRISVNRQPLAVSWAVVQDARGCEARGFSLFARPTLLVELEWWEDANAATHSAPTVEAEWRGAAVDPNERAAPQLSLLELPTSPAEGSEPAAVEEPAAGRDPKAETQVAAELFAKSAKTGGFFKWLDRVVARKQSESDETSVRGADRETPGENEISLEPADQGETSEPAAVQPGEAEVRGVESRAPATGAVEGQEPRAIPAAARQVIAPAPARAPEAPRMPDVPRQAAPAQAPAQDVPRAPDVARQVAPAPAPTPSVPRPPAVPRQAVAPAPAPAPVAPRPPAVPRQAVAPAPAPAPVAPRPPDIPRQVVAPGPATSPAVPRVPDDTGEVAVPASTPTQEGPLPAHPLHQIGTEDQEDLVQDAAAPAMDEPPWLESPVDPAAVRRLPRRPAWPAPSELRIRPSQWKRFLPLALVVVALFLGGWWLGRVQTSDRNAVSGSPPLVRALRAVGLGGARFDCTVTSQPAGAWIAVDGKDLAWRTPAALELTPGEHTVALTLPDQGTASFKVRGARGDRTSIDAPLWGSLTVRSPDTAAPIEVKVDGTARGFSPTTIRNLAPGPHEVEFVSPGMAPWGQTISIGVQQESEIVARPFESPATGLIEVRASLADDEGVEVVKGATVWVDGQRRGVTPLTLELPSGPHSVRVELRGEEAPVQVIDLPGGNQRFASFQFGIGLEQPKLALVSSPGPLPRDRPAVVSAALNGLTAAALREMWMHVRTPEGSWRRYPMALLEASGGRVGVAVFPLAMLDSKGRATFYVSASTIMGDEYFTELQNVAPAAGESTAPRLTTRKSRSSTP